MSRRGSLTLRSHERHIACECRNVWTTEGFRKKKLPWCRFPARWFEKGKFLCEKHKVLRNGAFEIKCDQRGKVTRVIRHELWMKAEVAEIRRTGHEPHFFHSPIGKYIRKAEINHYFTGKTKRSITGEPRMFYQVMLGDLSDDHLLWLMLRGDSLICREGESSKLTFFEESKSWIRILPDQGSGTMWVHHHKLENLNVPSRK